MIKKNNAIILLSIGLMFIFRIPLIANGFADVEIINDPNIHTVLLHRMGYELTPPIIKLNSGEQLQLSFDDFDADVKNYRFTVIHYTAGWTPSDIQQGDYLQGFTDDQIRDYSFSRNTIIKYTHYNRVFPSDNFQITKDGNYLLTVFDENNPEHVVFTRRFMIVDPQISISAAVSRAYSPSERDARQRIVFDINTRDYVVYNYQNLNVVITQNGRWDNAITNLKPKMIQGKALSYDYDEGNVFNGGNEYRHFDVKSLRYQSDRVRLLTYDTAYQVYLLPDDRRTYKSYITDKDIDGLFLVKTEDANDSKNESEYCLVHFTFPYPSPMVGGNIYVFGGLTDWKYLPEAEMNYNFKKSQYEAVLLVKQGYYNYQYVWLENGKTGDETLMEGNHFETENNYTIYVYYREPGQLSDRLIGIQFFNSIPTN